MRDILLTIYQKDRKDRTLLLIAGFSMVIAGWIFLFFMKGYFWFGLSVPILFMSALQLYRGTEGLILSIRRMKAVRDLDDNAASIFASMDLKRIQRLPAKYRKFSRRLILLIILGFAFLAYALLVGKSKFTLGTGMGLMWQAGLMMVFEMVFVWRAERALREINRKLN